MTKRLFLASLLWLATTLPTIAYADDWDFELEPYAMFTTIEGDASIGRVNGAEVDVDTDEILEVLHMGAMFHFEAHHDSGWGLALDYGFMDLRDDISGPRGGITDLKVRQAVLMAEVMKRQTIGESTLDYIVGVRWWDNDIEVDVDVAALPGSIKGEIKEDWVDAYVGARWQVPINQQWTFVLRGDVGGFGLEADFTSLVLVGAKYSINKTMQVDLMYKGLWVDYEDGSQGERGYFSYDTLTHGPVVGFIYKF